MTTLADGSMIDQESNPSNGVPPGSRTLEWQKTEIEGMHTKKPVQTYYYYDNPLKSSCVFLLITIVFAKTPWNGLELTLVGFLTGEYNPDWNAGFTPNRVTQFQALSKTLAFVTPFFAAIAADLFVGDYWTMVFCLVCFLVGMILTTLTAVPELLGSTFNTGIFKWGALVLSPIGWGIFETVVNIFIAKQFHPIKQRNQLEIVFTAIYVCWAVAGVLSELVLAIIIEYNVVLSYSLATACVGIALIAFLSGSTRYVVWSPERKRLLLTFEAFFGTLLCVKHVPDENGDFSKRKIAAPGFNKMKKSSGGKLPDHIVEDLKRLLLIIPFAALLLPLSIVFGLWVPQCIIMSQTMTFGVLGPGPMIFVNSLATAVVGFFLNHWLYPTLEKKKTKFATSHKFALGALFYGLTYITMILIFNHMKNVYTESGEKISIGWMSFPYIVLAFGLLFVAPPLDELTYVLAPTSLKTLGMAIQKFITFGIGGIIQTAILKVTKAWFPQTNKLKDYVSSDIKKLYWLMVGLSFVSGLVFLIPAVKNWIEWLDIYGESETAGFEHANADAAAKKKENHAEDSPQDEA